MLLTEAVHFLYFKISRSLAECSQHSSPSMSHSRDLFNPGQMCRRAHSEMAHIKTPQREFFVSHLPGLNRGPHPYHGCALPTELRWQFYPVFGHLCIGHELTYMHASHSMDATYSSCSGCMIFFQNTDNRLRQSPRLSHSTN